MTDFSAFKNQTFLSLETFRKTGVGVKSPVWFVQDGNALYIWTPSTSGKVKRLRNNARVTIAPCGRFGTVTGNSLEAHAIIDESPETVEYVKTLLWRKLGLFDSLFFRYELWDGARKGIQRFCLKITLNPTA